MSDQEELLKVLQDQGQQFLTSFASPITSRKKRKREAKEPQKISTPVSRIVEPAEDEEEWLGVDPFGEEMDESEDNNSEFGDKEFEQDDDDFTAGTTSRAPSVVVFADAWSKDSDRSTNKAQKRNFMSSKVSKLSYITSHSMKEKKGDTHGSDEVTNIQNDSILHHLVHTKLLSGSLNPELNLTPAQRKKALAGRVLELAGECNLGRGEREVRNWERNRAAKRVREGLLFKKKEREQKELEEAKNLGNYHPTLKKLYEPSTSPGASHPKKRDRGLKMGVGKFHGGMLKLTQDEISTAQGGGPSGIRGSRGRGRGRGRGRTW